MFEFSEMIPRIMIVDDTPANLHLLDSLLREHGYQVSAFPNAEMAIRAALKNPPDLFLLDINMPGLNGYEACEMMKANPILKDIPVIFISALNDPIDKVRAFRIGGLDYINKPFQFDEVLARVETHLKLYRMQRELADSNQHLEVRVAEQVKEIADSQLATILALAKLAESRDDATGKHLERVQALYRLLTQQLEVMGVYDEIFKDNLCENMHFACALHDIGKVAIPDAILLKPARLTPIEFEVIKTHTTIGAQTLQSVYAQYPNNLLKIGIDISRWHHERWDGKGYPDGLAGHDIPVSARIMSVVDVYDALRSKRPYKEALSHQQALSIMVQDSGQFDPLIISAFLQVNQQCEKTFTSHLT